MTLERMVQQEFLDKDTYEAIKQFGLDKAMQMDFITQDDYDIIRAKLAEEAPDKKTTAKVTPELSLVDARAMADQLRADKTGALARRLNKAYLPPTAGFATYTEYINYRSKMPAGDEAPVTAADMAKQSGRSETYVKAYPRAAQAEAMGQTPTFGQYAADASTVLGRGLLVGGSNAINTATGGTSMEMERYKPSADMTGLQNFGLATIGDEAFLPSVLGGAVFGAARAPALAAKLSAATTNAARLKPLATFGAQTGAIEGGISGTMHQVRGDAGLPIVTEPLMGVAGGGILGAALPVVGKGIRTGYNAVADKWRNVARPAIGDVVGQATPGSLAKAMQTVPETTPVPETLDDVAKWAKKELELDPVTDMPLAAHFDRPTSTTRLEQHIAQGPDGQPILNKFDNTWTAINKKLDDTQVELTGTAAGISPEQAMDEVATTVGKARDAMFDAAETSYDKFAKEHASELLPLTVKTAEQPMGVDITHLSGLSPDDKVTTSVKSWPIYNQAEYEAMFGPVPRGYLVANDINMQRLGRSNPALGTHSRQSGEALEIPNPLRASTGHSASRPVGERFVQTPVEEMGSGVPLEQKLAQETGAVAQKTAMRQAKLQLQQSGVAPIHEEINKMLSQIERDINLTPVASQKAELLKLQNDLMEARLSLENVSAENSVVFGGQTKAMADNTIPNLATGQPIGGTGGTRAAVLAKATAGRTYSELNRVRQLLRDFVEDPAKLRSDTPTRYLTSFKNLHDKIQKTMMDVAEKVNPEDAAKLRAQNQLYRDFFGAEEGLGPTLNRNKVNPEQAFNRVFRDSNKIRQLITVAKQLPADQQTVFLDKMRGAYLNAALKLDGDGNLLPKASMSALRRQAAVYDQLFPVGSKYRTDLDQLLKFGSRVSAPLMPGSAGQVEFSRQAIIGKVLGRYNQFRQNVMIGGQYPAVTRQAKPGAGMLGAGARASERGAYNDYRQLEAEQESKARLDSAYGRGLKLPPSGTLSDMAQ